MSLGIKWAIGVGGVDIGEFLIKATAIMVIIGADDVGVVLLSEGKEFFEGIEVDIVIGFDNADVFAGGAGETLVHAVAVAGVGLVDDNDAGILICECLDNIERRIG